MNNHLSEMQIQEWLVDGKKPDPELSDHLEYCEACRTNLASYEAVFTAITSNPRPALDFDLSELVLTGITKRKPPFSWSAFSVYLLGAVCLAGAAIPAYLYRRHIQNLFNGMMPMVVYLILASTITLLVFQAIELYKNYERKMHALNTE